MDALPNEIISGIERHAGIVDDALARIAMKVLEAEDAEDMYEAERAMRAAFLQRADAVVAVVLNHKVNQPDFVAQTRARVERLADAAGIKMKSNGARATSVRLLGGTVLKLKTLQLTPATAKRPGLKRGRGKRGKAGAGCYPALAQLGIVGLATPAVRAEIAREVAEANSVAVARASLAERGLVVPHRTALRLTYLFADRSLERRARRIVEHDPDAPDRAEMAELAGKHVAVCVDGGRLRVRVNPEDGRRNAKGHLEYEAQWREPKLFTVYVLDENGKKARGTETFIDGTLGDADAAFELLLGQLKVLGADLAKHVSLHGDGADWIWNRGEALRIGLGLRTDQFSEVVDRYHAVEYLGTASKNGTWSGDSTRTKWVKRAKNKLDAGRIGDLVEQIGELTSNGLSADEVATAQDYFARNESRMDYPAFRAAGIPIGSGSVESAIRRVINLRMKGNSIYWLAEHADGMIHLRSQLKSGRWDELARDTVMQPIWEPPECDDA